MIYLKKESRTVTEAGTTIVYQVVDGTSGNPTPITIESRKRHVPHANRAGTWDHTSYFVILNGRELEKHSLRDAESYADYLYRQHPEIMK